jgi:uncharacterized protein YbjT (DUF2867 family)
MKILVTGAAGRVGTAAVFALLNRGAQVRAMLHRPDRHAMFAPCDLECVTADLDDGPAVRAALSGVEAVLLISPLHPNLPVREIGLIEACSEGTARRVVKISALGADPDWPVPAPRWHGLVERHLRESALSWTVLQPNFFFQTLLEFADTVAAGTLAVPAGQVRISMVDTRDIGRAAAAVITQDGHNHRTYQITGPQAVSFNDVAQALTAATGHRITYLDLAPQQAHERMVAAGMPDWLIEQRDLVFASYRDAGRAGYPSLITTAIHDLTGRQPSSIVDFATEHASRFTERNGGR